MAGITIDGDAIVGAREEQEDARAIGVMRLSNGNSAPVAVVADGMGGHNGGAVASLAAVDGFVATAAAGKWATYPETLRQALNAANEAVAARITGNRRLEGMGCTLVAAVFDTNIVHHISVGDSLFLRIAGAGIERLNADHSMSPLLDAAGAPPDDPQRHMLRSALTGDRIALVDENTVTVTEESLFVVASDGLLTLDAPTLLSTVETAAGDVPAMVVRRLLERVMAEQRPDQDNCTIVAARVAPTSRGNGWARAAGGLLLVAGGMGVAALAWQELARPSVGPTAARDVPMAATAPERPSAPSPARRESYAADVPQPTDDQAAPVIKPPSGRERPTLSAPASAHSPSPRVGRSTAALDAIMGTIAGDDRVTGSDAPPVMPSPTPAASPGR